MQSPILGINESVASMECVCYKHEMQEVDWSVNKTKYLQTGDVRMMKLRAVLVQWSIPSQ